MKLEKALRKTIRMSGAEVLTQKRLLFILSDLRAFEEYPAVKQVLEAMVSGGKGQELSRLFLDDDRAGCISYAQDLRKSLSENSHFREDLADYAADSILYGLGLTDTVTEPSDHGFDPMEHGISTGNPGAGERKTPNEEVNQGRAELNAGGGAKEWGAGVTRREHSGETPPGASGQQTGSFRPRPVSLSLGGGSGGASGSRVFRGFWLPRGECEIWSTVSLSVCLRTGRRGEARGLAPAALRHLLSSSSQMSSCAERSLRKTGA